MNQIIDVRVAKIHHLTKGRIKAFADIIINNVFLIKGLKIIASPKGSMFVSMPQEQGKNQRFYDRVQCMHSPTRLHLCQIVLDAYQVSAKYANLER